MNNIRHITKWDFDLEKKQEAYPLRTSLPYLPLNIAAKEIGVSENELIRFLEETDIPTHKFNFDPVFLSGFRDLTAIRNLIQTKLRGN